MFDCPRIEIGSPQMLEAFKQGVEYYKPVRNSCNVYEVEAGITDHSVTNLKTMAVLRKPCTKIEAGPNGTIMFWYDDNWFLLTSGFGLGYCGEGPTKLAKMVEQMEFCSFEEAMMRILDVGQDYQGILFDR